MSDRIKIAVPDEIVKAEKGIGEIDRAERRVCNKNTWRINIPPLITPAVRVLSRISLARIRSFVSRYLFHDRVLYAYIRTDIRTNRVSQSAIVDINFADSYE